MTGQLARGTEHSAPRYGLGMLSRSGWCVVVALVTVGCGDRPSSVDGRVEYRFVQHDPAVSAPLDLSGYRFEVYVDDDSVAGGFDIHPSMGPVVGAADGTFQITDVPDGPYWLKMTEGDRPPTFLRKADHTIEISFNVLGRPGAVPATLATPLTVNAVGLAPWADGDVLVADCWDNATESFFVDHTLQPALVATATMIAASFDWTGPQDFRSYSWGPGGGPFLMDASLDQDFVLSRLATKTVSTTQVLTLTQVLTAPAVSQVDGQASTIGGAFVDVPLTSTANITVDLDAVGTNLPAGFAATSVGTSLLSGPGTVAGLSLGPSLLDVGSTQLTGTMTASEPYGNPFDPTWPVLATTYVNLTGSFSNLWDIARVVDGTYVFQLPPMSRAATLGGTPIDGQAIAWDGVSPLALAFDVSDEVNYISVAVFEETGPLGTGRFVANLSADRSPIVLPTGLLHAGQTYAFRIGVALQSADGTSRGSYLMTPQARL